MDKNKKIVPEYFADELDVYEALYTISKREGKNLLSPAQVKSLVSSGRVLDEEIKNFLSEKIESVLPKKVLSFIDMVVYGMYLEAGKMAIQEQKINPKDVVFIKKMSYEYFRLITGLAPNQMKKALVKEFEGKWKKP